jgi:DNA-binding SARP family transcriptional activator
VHAALDLWRGPAYAEVAERPWAATEAARLEELRMAAWELRIESAIRSGAPHEVVGSAQAWTRLYPWRPHGWRLLAVSLWATGRQVEALAALRQGPAVLTEDGAELQQAILAQRIEVLRAWTAPTRLAAVRG